MEMNRLNFDVKKLNKWKKVENYLIIIMIKIANLN